MTSVPVVYGVNANKSEEWTTSVSRVPGTDQKANETNLKRTLLCVHSDDRTNSDDTESHYFVRFPTIYNVRRVNLLSTEIPNAEYVVNGTNNLIDFKYNNGADLVATLTPGNYTGATLAAEIETQLEDAAGSPGVFGVSFSETTSKLTITVSANTFELLLSSGDNLATSAWYLMGFDSGTDTGAVTEETSDGIVRLAGANFVYLQIAGMQTMLTTDGECNVFAKILLDVPPGSIAFNSFVSNGLEWPRAKDKIHELEITFADRDGSLFTFNKMPNSFTLEFLHER
jgi:hypothetical protein